MNEELQALQDKIVMMLKSVFDLRFREYLRSRHDHDVDIDDDNNVTIEMTFTFRLSGSRFHSDGRANESGVDKRGEEGGYQPYLRSTMGSFYDE